MFSLLSANVFDKSSATPFSVLDPIDNTQVTQRSLHDSNSYDEIMGDVEHASIPVMPTQVPGVCSMAAHITPFTPTQGPGVHPTAAHAPPFTPMQGPGIPPVVAHAPPFTPMQGLGVPPVAAHVPPSPLTLTQGSGVLPTAAHVPEVTPTQGAEDDVTIPTIRVTAAKMKQLRQKRYQRTQKMSPGVG